ncbi:motility associated factor glycosyltransferase family protein [Hydrogenobacter hydrogenophilus]|uniref:Uncharacterized conserved protein n=1 Tax=Hydrogenobacter hydrogenophilus TaxID=35835 RepID=A0A285NSF6_9AQUI|nr:6-hydroxymethylpterin diphosphokinase MptE-like protein [Hydrogenobacter hydrogenophilus]SNZ12118.1 Uncharacterized conserved protein [Hydrogenobacter hydrogenophilus]
MNITQFLTSDYDIEGIKRKNLEYLQKVSPHFYNFLNLKGQVDCRVIYQKGKWELLVNGKPIYGGDAYTNTKRQFEEYLQKPNSFSTPFHLYEFPEDTIDGWFSQKLKQSLTSINLSESCKTQKSIGTVLVFGVGLGFHIDFFTQHYDIKQLILVETDVELIKPTLYTLDWEKILNVYDGKERIISFYLHKDPELLAAGLLDHLAVYYNPALLTHFHIYLHRYDHILLEGSKKFWESNKSPIAGFGYFQDELWSLEYTIENIKRELPLFYGKKPVPSDAVAFVIGAGPSLEYALDFIKQNQHRAVIFSCGSSIGTLYEEGIKPDFHVEIERTKMTYDALIKSASTDYLKELTAMYNNPMYPPVADLFKESLMWLKPNDAGSSLFPPDIPRIGYSNPTVVNGGLSLAIHMGFKEIYLFGTDMGYKDPKKHHARGNVALKEGTEFYKEKEVQEYELEGNFGGKVYTNGLLLWARSMIQDLLKMTKGVKVYNTSDGAKIEGTIPIKVGEITLRNFKKTEAIKLINSNFSKDYLKGINIDQKIKKLLDQSRAYLEFLKGFEVKNSDDFYRFVSQVGLEQWRYAGSPFMNLFRPAFLNFSYSLLSAVCRMPENQAIEKGKELLNLYTQFVERCIERLKEIKY